MVLTLENISAKSFYYPIHKNPPLEINPLYDMLISHYYKGLKLAITQLTAGMLYNYIHKSLHACNVLVVLAIISVIERNVNYFVCVCMCVCVCI